MLFNVMQFHVLIFCIVLRSMFLTTYLFSSLTLIDKFSFTCTFIICWCTHFYCWLNAPFLEWDYIMWTLFLMLRMLYFYICCKHSNITVSRQCVYSHFAWKIFCLGSWAAIWDLVSSMLFLVQLHREDLVLPARHDHLQREGTRSTPGTLKWTAPNGVCHVVGESMT